MDNLVWVRDLSKNELHKDGARTGDLLEDGSVLLWQEDMNRMGLHALRDWILHRVVDEHTPIAVGSVNAPAQPLLEEILLGEPGESTSS